MERSLYVSTQDDKGHGHRYRLPLTETVPDGHEIIDVRPAGQFRFTQTVSQKSFTELLNFRKSLARR
jgi:hypothetical protein